MGSKRLTIEARQIRTTRSLRSCASLRSGQNLSMTQNRMAPMTIVIRIPITSEIITASRFSIVNRDEARARARSFATVGIYLVAALVGVADFASPGLGAAELA